jgi:uroporphyrinogen decarboxylase
MLDSGKELEVDYDELREMELKGSLGTAPTPAASAPGELTLRERFRRTMFFQKVDHIPNFEFGYWGGLLEEWQKQGLPPEIDTEAKAYDYFGIESFTAVSGNLGLCPPFEEQTISEDDEYITYKDGSGVTARINKKGEKSIPHFIDFPIKTRDDWEEFNKRLDPDDPERIPKDLDEWANRYRNRDYPLGVGFGSMAGVPRNWIGFENIALMCYDDPELLEEIVETLCQISCTVLSKILPELEFDFACGWEDICFNSGPIISPHIFERIVVPRYQRITDLLHKHGVFIAYTDCDGNLLPILDLFLKGGINCMFPVEVHGGSDPIKMREMCGDKLLLWGGVDKMALIKGPKAIETELKRIEPEVRRGGFIPTVDHRVPGGVTLENYKCYMKLKREIFDVGCKKPQYDE